MRTPPVVCLCAGWPAGWLWLAACCSNCALACDPVIKTNTIVASFSPPSCQFLSCAVFVSLSRTLFFLLAGNLCHLPLLLPLFRPPVRGRSLKQWSHIHKYTCPVLGKPTDCIRQYQQPARHGCAANSWGRRRRHPTPQSPTIGREKMANTTVPSTRRSNETIGQCRLLPAQGSVEEVRKCYERFEVLCWLETHKAIGQGGRGSTVCLSPSHSPNLRVHDRAIFTIRPQQQSRAREREAHLQCKRTK